MRRWRSSARPPPPTGSTRQSSRRGSQSRSRERCDAGKGTKRMAAGLVCRHLGSVWKTRLRARLCTSIWRSLAIICSELNLFFGMGISLAPGQFSQSTWSNSTQSGHLWIAVSAAAPPRSCQLLQLISTLDALPISPLIRQPSSRMNARPLVNASPASCGVSAFQIGYVGAPFSGRSLHE
jgi:hypothetical protein